MSGEVDRNERSPLRTMPWWVAIIGTAAVAMSAMVTTLWLLSIAGHDASLRIEAIKVGLSVGAGTGGAVALLLAVRRQWLSERTQAHAEDVARITQAHAEAVARDNAYDATQRRVTELYGKAVEQLGHANAPVRLGGLYSLERLAQDHHEHRQTVVDVICAYLRMPYTPPPSTAANDQQPSTDEVPGDTSGGANHHSSDIREELQVRLTAQRLLTRHLASPADHGTANQHTIPDPYWVGMRIDLNGAHLIDLDFSNCRVANADFRNTQFSGDARFGRVQFSGDAGFDGAQFGGRAGFDGAQFGGRAGFDGAQFDGYAGFGEVQFDGYAGFGEVQFGRDAGFARAQFGGDAGFGRARFGGRAWFAEARFGGRAGFGEVRFGGHVGFGRVQFSGYAGFGRARFSEDADFGEARFSEEARFGEAQFSKDAGFGRVQFSGYADFGEVQFSEGTSFGEARFSEDARFGRAQFGGHARFKGAEFNAQLEFTKAEARHHNWHAWPDGWQIEPSSPPGIMAPLVRRK